MLAISPEASTLFILLMQIIHYHTIRIFGKNVASTVNYVSLINFRRAHIDFALALVILTLS